MDAIDLHNHERKRLHAQVQVLKGQCDRLIGIAADLTRERDELLGLLAVRYSQSTNDRGASDAV